MNTSNRSFSPRRVLAPIAVFVAFVLMEPTPALAAVTINEYQGPATIGPNDAVTGPDGNLWIANNATNEIWAMAPAGTLLHQYSVPTASSRPWGITAGRDGNLWFTESQAGKVGRLTPSGVFTEFALPVATNGPETITVGPDCSLWFTEGFPSKVGRITVTGSITEFPLSSISAEIRAIASGPDGNLWFTEYGADKIGRITPMGKITEYPVSITAGLGGGGPAAIALGWDGNLWFTMEVAHAVARITPKGVITYYTLRSPSATEDTGIARGPDGNVWFTDPSGNAIGQISPGGTIVENSVPTASSGPIGITTGPDGNVWFTEYGTGKIGQVIVPTPSLPGSPRNVAARAGSQSVQVRWSVPFYNGGSSITGYTVTPYIGKIAQTPVTVSASPALVTGLTNGVAYKFTVVANNPVGTSWPTSTCGVMKPHP
jgi:virginiamycin B lyase